jgi:hypothetical protein
MMWRVGGGACGKGGGRKIRLNIAKYGGGGGGTGRSEMAGNIGPGGGGSLPVSLYFSYNLKLKSLNTFGYTVDLSAEISFFAIVHSTLQYSGFGYFVTLF